MRITWVDDLEMLWPRAKEWNALVRGNRTDTVFQTFEWQASWCRAFAGNVRLLVLLVEDDDELVGIAPLMISNQKLLRRPRRVVEFIGADSADYCDFILGRLDVLPLLLDWLIQHAELWDVIDLSNIVGTSPLVELIPQHFQQRGFPAEVEHVHECPTRRFVDPEEDRKLLQKKSLRRYTNWFLRAGTLEFRYIESVEEATAHLQNFFDQHIRRWEPAGFPSRFRDERHCAFFRNLAELMLPKGEAKFSVLLFNGKPLAYEFGFEYSDRYYAVKPTFEPEYANQSPGAVHQRFCMEDVMGRGVGEYDFTVGEEAYKYRYANHVRHVYRARVYPHAVAYQRDRLMLWVRGHVWNLRNRLRATRGGEVQAPRPAGAESEPREDGQANSAPPGAQTAPAAP